MADLPPLRFTAVTPAEVESLWQDGVVHLPGVLPLEWVAALVEPVERTVTTGEAADLAVLAPKVGRRRARSPPGSITGATTRRSPPFATASPLAAIAAAVLRSPSVFFWEDSVE